MASTTKQLEVKLPTAESFSDSFSFYEKYGDREINWESIYNFAKEFAQMHVKAALKAASESKVSGKYERGKGFSRFEGDTEAILQSYPLTEIK